MELGFVYLTSISQCLSRVISLANETYREDIEEWDSVADLNLFIELENEFEIYFGINKSYNLKTVGQLISFNDEKLVEQGLIND